MADAFKHHTDALGAVAAIAASVEFAATLERQGMMARDVTIAALGSGGDGIVAALDGAPAAAPEYVAFALPGERWRLSSDTAPELISAAPDRVAPLCPHYTRCGGCLAQHMPPATYAAWKVRALVDAFAHRGLDVEPAPLRSFPPNGRRRATFAVGRRSPGSHGGDGVVVGFHRAGSHDIEPISTCAVVSPAIVAALPGLDALADVCVRVTARAKPVARRGRSAAAASPRDPLRLAVLATDTGLTIDIQGLGGGAMSLDTAARTRFAEISSRHGFAVVSVDGDVLIKRAAARLVVSGVTVEPPAVAFLQAVAAAEAAMVDVVVTAAGRAKRVADLFSGLGTFTFALAKRASVLAVDSDAALLASLTHAFAHAQGLKPVETLRRDLMREPLSQKELEPFDCIVFDPPRAGAQSQVERIARAKARTVIAVSCNPATLARDARVLIDGGYRLATLVPIDQFAFTAHLEAVAVFTR